MEVSFGLPPADQTLIAALSTPAIPVVEAEPIAEMPDIETTSETTSPANEVEAATVVASEESQLGVRFLASDDIATDAPLAQSVEQDAAAASKTTEEAIGEEPLTGEPVVDEVIASEPAADEQSEEDLFSLRSQPAADTSRLQSLLNGILPRNQQVDEATPEPVDSPDEAAQSFWRTEDKVVDQK